MTTDRKYSVIKAASWYTIGNILIKSASFFILPVFTRLMSVHDYGVYSTYTAEMAVLETVLLCGLSSTVKMAKYSEIDYDSYVTSILTVPFFLTALVGIAINIIFFDRIIFFGMNRTLWNYLLFTVAFVSTNSVLSGKIVVDGKYKIFMGYSVIYTVGNIGISLLLCFMVYREHDTYMARVVGTSIATVLSTVFLLFCCRRGVLKIKYIGQGLRWGIPLLFHGIAATLMAQSDRILIQKCDGYVSAGIYSIAVTMMAIPMVIMTSLENAWIPWFYDKLNKKKYDVITRMNNLYISFFAIIIAGFMLVSPEIIKIFTHQDYWDSVYSLAPLSVSVFAEMLYLFPLNMELYYKKTKRIAVMTTVAMMFNIIFDIICIVKIHYVAAAFVTFIARYLLFLLHWFYKNKFDCNKIADEKIIFVSSVILITLSIGMQVIAEMIMVRWGLAVLILAFVVIYVKRNQKFLKEIFGRRKMESV